MGPEIKVPDCKFSQVEKITFLQYKKTQICLYLPCDIEIYKFGIILTVNGIIEIKNL
jgi:hypothetical protein